MINRILMELYDDFEKDNLDSLLEFSKKTFSNEETQNLFAGCCLILFLREKDTFEPRYHMVREELLSIALSAKEKVGNSNLLAFYIDRVNTEKMVTKYLRDVVNNPNVYLYADTIIDYLEQFKPNFVDMLKTRYKENIEKYVSSLEGKKM